MMHIYEFKLFEIGIAVDARKFKKTLFLSVVFKRVLVFKIFLLLCSSSMISLELNVKLDCVVVVELLD